MNSILFQPQLTQIEGYAHGQQDVTLRFARGKVPLDLTVKVYTGLGKTLMPAFAPELIDTTQNDSVFLRWTEAKKMAMSAYSSLWLELFWDGVCQLAGPLHMTLSAGITQPTSLVTARTRSSGDVYVYADQLISLALSLQADVAQNATTATAKATEATSAATVATTKAGEASASASSAAGSAGLATTKAGEALASASSAAGSAGTATTKAAEASVSASSAAGSAAIATTKAGEAAASATAATGSASTATTKAGEAAASASSAAGSASTATTKAAEAVAARNEAVSLAGNVVALISYDTISAKLGIGGSIQLTDHSTDPLPYVKINFL